jgi:hypothetical protein
MLIPASPEELRNLNALTDKLVLALEPYVGYIRVTHPGQKRPNNGTGVVVNAPDAPGGAVVLSARHVAEDAGFKYEHDILIPLGPRDGEGVFLARKCRIKPYSIHAHLDLASFIFEDYVPVHKWEGIKKPPAGENSGHALAFGFATRDADWESQKENFDVSIGTTAFLLRTISYGADIAQLELNVPHKHGSYPGLSGAPVWQFSAVEDGLKPHLAGLVKGMAAGQTDITMHCVHQLKPDGKWLFSA